MRRKPTTQGTGGYNNQQRKPRYQQNGSNGGDHRSHNPHHNSGGGRPRKNYAASREKYLAQARDALASGDRVLAENYFQHADHCYRMMVEEGYQVRNNYTPPPAGEEQAGEHSGNQSEEQGDGTSPQAAAEEQGDNVGQLPAFLTTIYDHPEQAKPAEPVIVQGWEEQ